MYSPTQTDTPESNDHTQTLLKLLPQLVPFYDSSKEEKEPITFVIDAEGDVAIQMPSEMEVLDIEITYAIWAALKDEGFILAPKRHKEFKKITSCESEIQELAVFLSALPPASMQALSRQIQEQFCKSVKTNLTILRKTFLQYHRSYPLDDKTMLSDVCKIDTITISDLADAKMKLGVKSKICDFLIPKLRHNLVALLNKIIPEKIHIQHKTSMSPDPDTDDLSITGSHSFLICIQHFFQSLCPDTRFTLNEHNNTLRFAYSTAYDLGIILNNPSQWNYWRTAFVDHIASVERKKARSKPVSAEEAQETLPDTLPTTETVSAIEINSDAADREIDPRTNAAARLAKLLENATLNKSNNPLLPRFRH